MDENTVNAVQDPVVEGQENGQPNTDTGVTNEPAAVQSDEKPVQSPEENSRYAEIRRKAEREAEDRVYANLYSEYGIKSKADYEAYMANLREQELIESLQSEEADPEQVKAELRKQWEETDPRLKEYNQLKSESYIKSSIEELNNDLADTGIDVVVKTLDDLDKLPNAEKMSELIQNGRTLAEAYFLANKKEIIAKQAEKAHAETLRKTASLDGSSPGALDATADTQPKSIYSLSKEDFAKLKEDVLMRRRN